MVSLVPCVSQSEAVIRGRSLFARPLSEIIYSLVLPLTLYRLPLFPPLSPSLSPPLHPSLSFHLSPPLYHPLSIPPDPSTSNKNNNNNTFYLDCTLHLKQSQSAKPSLSLSIPLVRPCALSPLCHWNNSLMTKV